MAIVADCRNNWRVQNMDIRTATADPTDKIDFAIAGSGARAIA